MRRNLHRYLRRRNRFSPSSSLTPPRHRRLFSVSIRNVSHESADQTSSSLKRLFDLVDRALAKSVQIVVIDGGATAGRLYEAACLLNSLFKGHAYLLTAERVDIATAVGARCCSLRRRYSGAIVGRNTLMGSNPDSVVVPQDVDSALSASSSEGADFLRLGEDKQVGLLSDSLLKSVKIPIFVTCTSNREAKEELQSMKSGSSGFEICLLLGM